MGEGVMVARATVRLLLSVGVSEEQMVVFPLPISSLNKGRKTHSRSEGDM